VLWESRPFISILLLLHCQKWCLMTPSFVRVTQDGQCGRC
jgi:hypothetical protein